MGAVKAAVYAPRALLSYIKLLTSFDGVSQ